VSAAFVGSKHLPFKSLGSSKHGRHSRTSARTGAGGRGFSAGATGIQPSVCVDAILRISACPVAFQKRCLEGFGNDQDIKIAVPHLAESRGSLQSMNRCRCTNASHKNHPGSPCALAATENDGYCNFCHDRAADEFIQAIPIVIHASNKFTLKDSINLDKQTEFYENNHWAIVLSAIIAVLSAGIGVLLSGWFGAVIGLVIWLLSTILLPPTATKIRQIERTSGH
jgi:hypothetical protein